MSGARQSVNTANPCQPRTASVGETRQTKQHPQLDLTGIEQHTSSTVLITRAPMANPYLYRLVAISLLSYTALLTGPAMANEMSGSGSKPSPSRNTPSRNNVTPGSTHGTWTPWGENPSSLPPGTLGVLDGILNGPHPASHGPPPTSTYSPFAPPSTYSPYAPR